MSDPSTLLSALDRFLEVAGAVANSRAKRKALSPIERDAARGLAKAFRAQGKAFVRALAKFRDRFPRETAIKESAIEEWEWGPLFDEAALKTLRAFLWPLDRAMRRALLKGALRTIGEAETAVAFDLKNPRAVAWLQGHAADRVAKVNDTTKAYLKAVITQGVDEGWSYDRMARAIVDRYEEMAVGRPQQHIDSRAHLIAVTEAGDAYEEGNLEAAHELAAAGLSMEKAWSTVGDERVDAECQANEGQGWIPLEQPFQSGHQRPLAHPGCRCDLLTRRKGAEE